MINAMKTLGKGSPWDKDTKVSDEFLIPLFRKFFMKLDLYNVMDKKNFHELARFVSKERIDPEVKEKLEREPWRLFRIGTWELGDSLALEGKTGQAAELSSRAAGRAWR